MDDLTELKGIGKSGAQALAAAGLATFAAIGAADPEQRPEGLSPSLDWADVIAQAKDRTTETTNTQQGQSGTAREAPSTGSGTAAEISPPVVGTQSAAPNTSPGEEAEPLFGEFLLVTGPKRGRWRGGRHFAAEPTLLDLAQLTDDQEEAIRGDRRLSWVLLTADEVIEMQREAK